MSILLLLLLKICDSYSSSGNILTPLWEYDTCMLFCSAAVTPLNIALLHVDLSKLRPLNDVITRNPSIAKGMNLSGCAFNSFVYLGMTSLEQFTHSCCFFFLLSICVIVFEGIP